MSPAAHIMCITIKPGKMVAYLNKHVLIKFQETLITWSYLHYDSASGHQTWQNLNLPWSNYFCRVTWKLYHVVLSDHLTNWNHYLHYHSMYGHQTWQDGNQPWLAPTYKVTWSFDHLFLEITWQTKIILCPQPQYLWSPNFAGP